MLTFQFRVLVGRWKRMKMKNDGERKQSSSDKKGLVHMQFVHWVIVQIAKISYTLLETPEREKERQNESQSCWAFFNR